MVCVVAALVLGPATPPSLAQSVPLRFIVNGETVSLPGNAIIQNGIVMASYQGLLEPLGVRATWNSHDRMLTLVSPAGDEMELRSNDPYATVNGERRLIPVPLVMVVDRILIPVQWVVEALGDISAYDPSSRTVVINSQITGITWRGTDAGLEVAIEGTAPLHARTLVLHKPERLVVDVRGAVPKTAEPVIDIHEGPLTTARIGSFPGGTRIVFDLAAPAQYLVQSSVPARRLVIALFSGSAPPGPPSSYVPSALKITDVRYLHMEGGGRVVVVATQPLQLEPRILQRPDRIVIDISDAVFLPVKKTLDIDDGLVVQIRAAQFHSNPNVARIVVELARPTPYAVHVGTELTQALLDLGAAAAAPGFVPGPRGPHGPVVVALDPGHGGTDPGAIGPTGVREKDVVLAIAQALRTLLQQKHIDVVMVRDSDVFVPLEDRAQIAARGGATMFVSIHANGSVDANANGTQTFYAYSPSAPLAGVVLEEVSRAAGLPSRGSTQAQFKVLVESPQTPAILVETAFITNAREEQMLRDPATQQMFAQGIFRGIERYLTVQQAATQ